MHGLSECSKLYFKNLQKFDDEERNRDNCKQIDNSMNIKFFNQTVLSAWCFNISKIYCATSFLNLKVFMSSIKTSIYHLIYPH